MPLSLPSLPDKDTNDANADVEAAQWEMTMTRENGFFFKSQLTNKIVK
jgi:hypothetical protein